MTTCAPPPTAVVRPIAHFTPPEAWLNDPNGLVHLDGEYHLFYQHHPDADVWGPMHWGHAVSRDLLRWEHLPVALAPDEHGAIFSGSAVVDSDGVAGLGRGALLAFFTHHRDGCQRQSLAYSTDAGRSWTKYAGNPVLVDETIGSDFRDPRVLRYEGPTGSHWVMLVAAGNHVRFYGSDDLLSWRFLSTLGADEGGGLGVFETPDLFPVPVAGTERSRWVLSVGHLDGGPCGGSGMRYLVGDFDGTRFAPDEPAGRIRWADHGADFYAAQTWSHEPDDRPIWVGWVNNWAYADRIPSTGWRGMLSLPRELRPDGLFAKHALGAAGLRLGFPAAGGSFARYGPGSFLHRLLCRALRRHEDLSGRLRSPGFAHQEDPDRLPPPLFVRRPP